MVDLDYDDYSDVLYVKIKKSRIFTSEESKFDHELIINKDNLDRVVGLQLIGAKKLGIAWLEHDERKNLPEVISKAVDLWVEKLSD